MLLITCVVFVIAMVFSSCYSEDAMTCQQLERNTDKNFQRIFEILAAQDEKINRLRTMTISSQLLPKCTAAQKNKNLISSSKCWTDLVEVLDQPTELQLFDQLIRDSYDGDNTRLPLLVTFIQNNAEKGSKLAVSGYEALLDAMDMFGHLYFKVVPSENGKDVGLGFKDYTYRMLIQIREAEGESSSIFKKTLPPVLNSILTGKEMYIRNNLTGEYMYTSDNSTILVGGKMENNSRYLWKLKPVTEIYRNWWKSSNQETFYLVNSFENKILSVEASDGILKVVKATNASYDRIPSMVYIRLFKGSSGEEVIIQCKYNDVMKTLGLDENEDSKIPKLFSEIFYETPSPIWLLQPKEE